MAKHKSGIAISADGSYEFTVDPGRKYAFEAFYAGGTGTVTLFSGIVGIKGGDKYQAIHDPSAASLTEISIAATGTLRAFNIQATGNRIRLTVASASSLVLIPILTPIPYGA